MATCQYPNQATADAYKLHKSLVTAWKKQEAVVRARLTTKQHENGKYRGALVLARTKAGRRMRLGGGRSACYPLAEQATYDEFARRRNRGLRMSGRIIRGLMRGYVREHYGAAVVENGNFKATR